MQIKYYETAWRDISNSPNWFGKLCLLALVNFVPIFGQIVTFGYLYGWAREIAWGVHAPMPAKLISNEDGKFWSRGWFILVLTFVFALVPGIVMSIGTGMQGGGMWAAFSGNEASAGGAVMSGFGTLIYFVGLVGSFLAAILAWIGSMRIAIYNRLSAGFQLDKIWKMFRHDTNGILRIFGMELLFSFILGIILSIVMTVLMMIVVFVGVSGLAAAGFSPSSLQHMSDTQAMQLSLQFIVSAGVVGIICLLVMCFAAALVCVFIYMLVFRAVGYWTNQFDVAHWRGQDDPLPFELVAVPVPGAQAWQPEQSAYGAQPVQQPDQSVQQVPQGMQATQPVEMAQPMDAAQPVEATQAVETVQPVEATQPVEAAQAAQTVPQPEQPQPDPFSQAPQPEDFAPESFGSDADIWPDSPDDKE